MANQDDLDEFINDLGRIGGVEDTIEVYARGTPKYESAVVHRFPNGIREVTRFVVEPGSEIGLCGLLKSGGHISIPKINPPNKGILISLQRFNHIAYDKEKKTLDVGAGVIWKDVYEYLETFVSDSSDHAPGVVGGDPLVGVSGWLLGGGYSLLTNRFGLGIDNVIRFRILLPDGKGVCNISSDTKGHLDLFKALKGGGHNFGIITQFTLRVHDRAKRLIQTDYTLSKKYPIVRSGAVKDWLVTFIDKMPPEATAVAAFRHDLRDGKVESYIPFCVWWTGDSSHQFQIPDVSDLFRNVTEKKDLAQFSAQSSISLAPDLFRDVTEKRDLAQFSAQSSISLAPDLFRDVTEKRDLAQFFFSGSDGVKSSSLQSQSPRSMSLAEAYEAFSLRNLPVSLETLQSDSHFVHLNASSEIKKKSIGALLQSSVFAEDVFIALTNRNSLTVFTAGNKKVVMESPPDLRGRMACIMVTTYTGTLINAAKEQAENLSLLMEEKKGIRVSYEIWPFHKNAFNGVKQEDSAWPHEEGKVFGPLVGWFEWSGKDNDKYWLEQISNSLRVLHQVALKENCTTEDLPMYLNITLEDTSVKDIYRDHYEELKLLRRVYDPNDVMGLAAGFVIDAKRGGN
ncbi:hypothetical protein K443DRAFT_125166 [Laccaria amethystina LaAM-08-1]|uniref:FAD-binding PCMH-type domain-containing protein n=1 Tax=Laccaria amethystina LaAM-08-1 TaxID=1095629 RepID=A0A0C9XEK5_9AGAR|nr:hypothetical protein K443DRAFT_125166 [Laccaria amethystina LaAM-08-1]